MVRLLCAVLSFIIGLVALTFPLIRGVFEWKSLGFFSYVFQDMLTGNLQTLYFVGLIGLGLSALGAMFYGACVNDKIFRRAAWAITIIFAMACLYRAFEVFSNGNRGAFRIENSQIEFLLAVSAAFALVVALRKEELPNIARPNLFPKIQFQLPTHPLGLQADSRAMLPVYVLGAFAVVSLAVAAFLPVTIKIYYGSSNGMALFVYSPAFVVLMLLPFIGVVVAFLAERSDIQKFASGAATILTLAMLTLILRDFVDSANDYTYGLFPSFSRSNATSEKLGWGFWMLAYSGLCWIGVCLNGFAFLGHLPGIARYAGFNQRTPHSTKAPIDVVELAHRFVFSALTFVFCASCFPLGIFLWRYFDEQNNRLVNVALAGWMMGLAFALLRLFLIFSIGASASNN